MKVSRGKPVESLDDIGVAFIRAVADWRTIVGLDAWRINVTIGKDCLASCQAEPAYKTAVITFDPGRMRQKDFTPLHVESTALHELVHAVLWPLANEAANPKLPESVQTYFEESATEVVTESLLRARYGDSPVLRTLWSN